MIGYSSRKLVVVPSLNMRREYKICGSLVRVISGAWGSWKISFDAPPAFESNRDDQSSRLINGSTYSSPNGDRFQTFWLTTATLHEGVPENLVLEVFDCATPVVALNDGRGAGWRYHNSGGATTTAEITGGSNVVLYTDNAWGASGEVDDQTGVEFLARRFIGGGIVADGPFVAWIMSFLTKNGTKLAQHAKLTASATDIVGQYSVSFESPEIPWPMFGLKIYLAATGTPDIQNYTWNLYGRTP